MIGSKHVILPWARAALASVALVVSGAAQSAPGPDWLAAPVDLERRAPADFGPEHFRARRAALMAAVGEGVIFLRGAPKPPNNGSFYQDQHFFYLTGIDEPNVAMLLFPATGEEVLLVPPFNRFRATWDGEFLAPGEASAKRTGFAEVGNSSPVAVSERIVAAFADSEGAGILWTWLQPAANRSATGSTAGQAARDQKRDPFDGRDSREAALRARLTAMLPGVEIRDVSGAINRLRGIKTEPELVAIRRATELAADGIAEAMRSVQPGMMEYELAAVARYVFSRGGGGPAAYAAIVGGGPNGCILHYDALKRRLLEDDLIVMDYAPTFAGYASDVTRTFPANGKFSPAQRKLVEDVAAVQAELIGLVRPGATLRDISRRCNELLREKGYGVDHGPCHHVGLAVHDEGGGTLEPGMVITVEPGAYLRKEGMGCRIEDVVVVTVDGCINLSASLPSTPDAIEAWMAGRGVGNQPVGLPKN